MTNISAFPIQEFSGNDLGGCMYLDNEKGHTTIVTLRMVFDWIKKEAVKQDLTVELRDNRITFIKSNTDDTN